jgi:hypothetical protein
MAGAGYKLFNTGDVLTAAQVNTYLMEQSVMRFATTTARDTALSGVLAEGMICYIDADNNIYKYTGSAWTNIDTSGGGSPLTTKGDLYTYSTTDARLGVGSNGETLVADSAATTGLRWTAMPAASNPILNSAMDVWQRGTSFSLAASTSYTSGFTADRWQTQTNANQACTISRQATSDTTNLPNIQYCLRYQRNSGQTGTGTIAIYQNMETANSIPLAGKTVTFSYYARAGANYSPTSSAFIPVILTGTGTDQNSWAGYTGSSTVLYGSVTLTTTWQRFTHTVTLGATATEIAVGFQWTPTGTASTNDYFEVTGIQLDIGNTALPFRRAMNTLAGELAACQRYFYQIGPGAAYSNLGMSGFFNAATQFDSTLSLPASMRTKPTVTSAGNFQTNRSAIALSSPVLGNSYADGLAQYQIEWTCTGATQYQASTIRNNNSTTAYLALSAEL